MLARPITWNDILAVAILVAGVSAKIVLKYRVSCKQERTASRE
jgi:hypothetical protein